MVYRAREDYRFPLLYKLVRTSKDQASQVDRIKYQSDRKIKKGWFQSRGIFSGGGGQISKGEKIIMIILQPDYLSIYLSIYIDIFLSINLFIYLSI